MNHVIHNPFPSLIYQVKLDIDVEKMTTFITDLANTINQHDKDWNLWYSHYNLPSLDLLDPMFVSLNEQIKIHSNKFYKLTHTGPRAPLEVQRMWGCVYKKGGHMRPHTHHESMYAACVYLKNNNNGKITFTHPSQLRFNATVDFAPEAGELLIWPGWLLHEVPPIIDDYVRVTIPAKIDFVTPRKGLEDRQVDSEYI